MKTLLNFSAVCLVVLLLSSCLEMTPRGELSAEFGLDSLYGEHMVLQRNRPIRIGGTGEPGKLVRVELLDGEGECLADGIADVQPNGHWELHLPKQSAGGPYSLRISGKDGVAPLVLKDVLVGDVWICSGQSNMEMPVKGKTAIWQDDRYEEILEEAPKYSRIRLFNEAIVKQVSPVVLNDQPRGHWTTTTREEVIRFSATAINFGMQLAKDVPDVPIGLVSLCWSGTKIEPWISAETYEMAGRAKELNLIKMARMPEGAERDAFVEQLQKEFLAGRRAWTEEYLRSASAANPAASSWNHPDYDDSQWTSLNAPMTFMGVNETGTAWARKCVEIPEAWLGHDLLLHLQEVDDIDWTYVNGEFVGKTIPDQPAYWGVKRLYRIPAELVNSRRLVIAVRFANLYGVGGLPGPADSYRTLALADNPSETLELQGPWKFQWESRMDTERFGGLPKKAMPKVADMNGPSFPATLYNSLIHPWLCVPVCGVIWYQGCSNAENATDYLGLQKLLIENWRRDWKNPELPFIITQLSSYGPFGDGSPDFWKHEAPATSLYGALREAQLLAHLSTPNTGLAVTIDHGMQYDIHPHNKTIVGYRLAKEAERLCYGYRGATAGPIFKKAVFKDGKAIVSFDNVGGGLVAQGSSTGLLNGFVLAGADGIFHHARAVVKYARSVIKSDTVIVSSPEVPEPVAVRYAWVSYAEGLNLYNAEGFPASPFRSDIPAWVREKTK